MRLDNFLYAAMQVVWMYQWPLHTKALFVLSETVLSDAREFPERENYKKKNEREKNEFFVKIN